MKKYFLKILNIFCNFFPMKKAIIFESNPDLACNSYAVFKYIYDNNLLMEYKIIWRVNDNLKYRGLFSDRVSFIRKNAINIIDYIRNYKVCNRAMINISCVSNIPKYKCGKQQINIYLDHGSQLKEMKVNNEPCRVYFDYTISQAKFFNKYIKDVYGVLDNQIIDCGIPRNDQFFEKKKDMSVLFDDFYKFSKVIAWVPTFRIASNHRVDCDYVLPLGIPLLYNIEALNILNNNLKELNCLIIIKPHPAQALEIIKASNLSNIRFLYNNEMLSCNIQTNEFLNCCDAMITDYSGIYFDFLLTERPIAITLDDYEAYKEQHGFVFNEPLKILKGDQCYKLSDLIIFIKNVCNNIDLTNVERNKIKKLTNDYADGNSTERFFKFLLNEISKKI